MKKIIIALLLSPSIAFANKPINHDESSHAAAVGVGVGVSKSTAYSNSKSYAQGGNAVAAGFGGTAASFSKGGSGGNASVNGSGGSATAEGANVSFQGDKYPNQAPAIFTTSAPSFSQRNCTPVGSVNMSGPFGGLGVALPMGGDTCDGLNTADKVADWERESGDIKLWLVQCNLMVEANDDLAEAFEKAGYSCQDAYLKRQSDANARAKMTTLYQQR